MAEWKVVAVAFDWIWMQDPATGEIRKIDRRGRRQQVDNRTVEEQQEDAERSEITDRK